MIVDRADILEANLRARERAKNGPTASRESAGPAMYEDELPDECLREFEDRARRFQRIYVSMQEDGSEDDLSYIKLINYGDKVVTNRMHGYLRMRIAQFLSVIHPTPHVIYLSRHGQSEYNVLGKLGGNPPLSPAGQEYARRPAAAAALSVARDSRRSSLSLSLPDAASVGSRSGCRATSSTSTAC